MPGSRPVPRGPRLDVASILVAPLGIAIVLASQVYEGVSMWSLLNGTAALIVLGGTLGAVLVTYTPTEVMQALRAAMRAYRVSQTDTDTLAASLVSLSIRAHRSGTISLESELDTVTDPYFRDGLAMVVDNTPATSLREFLAMEKAARDAEEEAPARVFEAAAGYAPTLGILGAVLGLIRVMEHLGAPATLGAGIAVAFVATVYGVGIANLVLLPIAGRLRERSAQASRRRDLIAEGIRSIQERVNPRLVAQKLRSFSPGAPRVEEVMLRMGTRPPRFQKGAQ